MDNDYIIGSAVFSRHEIDLVKESLASRLELLIEGFNGLPTLDFRLFKPEIFIRGDLTSHNASLQRIFCMQLLGAKELVQERCVENKSDYLPGNKIDCILDIPFAISYFEMLISVFIKSMAKWAFENNIELIFYNLDVPETEFSDDLIKELIQEAWISYKNNENYDETLQGIVTVSRLEK